MPGLIDHLFVFLLLVAVPITGYRGYHRLIQRLASGEPGVRLREYRSTIAFQWAIAALLVSVWLWKGRQLSGLGLAIPADWRSFLGLGLTLATAAFLAVQWRSIRRLEGDALAPLRKQLEGASALLPHSDEEHRLFRGLALTAGICEEVVYRGFLVWYFAAWLGLWPAVVVAAIGFGLGHFYQGRSGVGKTGLAGLVMGGLYAVTGSLAWPMVVHALVDLQGGAVGRRVVGEASVA